MARPSKHPVRMISFISHEMEHRIDRVRQHFEESKSHAVRRILEAGLSTIAAEMVEESRRIERG